VDEGRIGAGTEAVAGTSVDVLIPAFDREGALAVTLTGLLGQQEPPGRVLVSDQSPDGVIAGSPLVAGVCRVLRARGVPVEVLRHPSGEGVAENRAFLLEQAQAPYVLFLDDDIVLEPEGLARMCDAMGRLRTGIVAMAMTGLSHAEDVREHEWAAFAPLTEGELPGPERIRKADAGWDRWRLHNAANPTHLGERLGLSRFATSWTAYRIAWAAGCVLFDRAELVASGGFDFWPELGRRGYGEDVVAQLRVQERAGAVGLLPTAAHHLELPTTMGARERDAYELVLGSRPSDADA
jgi:glycosyltransferase involved in cell wall biosynthesis